MLCIQAWSEHSNITNPEELNRIGSSKTRQTFYSQALPDPIRVFFQTQKQLFLISGFECLKKDFMIIFNPHES
jgi:hypothetical protein